MENKKGQTVSVPQLYAIVDYISEVSDQREAIRLLSSLSNSVKLHGISATASALSINTIASYIDGAIGLISRGNRVDTVVDDLKVKLSSAINERSEMPDVPYAISRQPSQIEGHPMSVAFYNPTFDPGADTATCVELNGKVVGLAFSTKGIKNILSTVGIHMDAEQIQHLTADAGVFIAEDVDVTYTPEVYAEGLKKEFSTKLNDRIIKGSTVTYSQLIEGYEKMAKRIVEAAENYYDNLTTSQLRTLLLDTWVASNRPAKFNKDKINYMDREELIESIEAQEVMPVQQEKDAHYTRADIFKVAEDEFLSGNTDAFTPPMQSMTSTEIKAELQKANGILQDPDTDVTIELNNDMVNVSSPNDNVNESFEIGEIDDAIDFYQELLSRNNLTHTAAEVKDTSIPPMEDVNWAKQIISLHVKKQQAFSEAMAVATDELRKKLQMADLSQAERARAEEIILRKLQAIKTGTYKLDEDLYATIKVEQTGGSDSFPTMIKIISDTFNIEKAMLDTIKAKAKTPIWEKHMLLLKDKGKDMPGQAYFKKDIDPTKKASVEGFQSIMTWADELFDGFEQYYEIEADLLNNLKAQV